MVADRDFLTIDDIIDIGGTTLNTYEGHTWERGGTAPSGEQWKDLVYPISKRIPYGDLREITRKNTLDNTPINEMFLVSTYLGGSDYSGSMLERSNNKVFLEDYGNEDGVFDVYGDFGTFDVAISAGWLLDPKNIDLARQIIETLQSLNDYPAIDDEDMSNMEYEAFQESLRDWGYRDAMDALAKKFNISVYDYNEDAFIDMLEEVHDDRQGNPSWVVETGGAVYIDIDKLIENITLEDLKKVLMDWEMNDLPAAVGRKANRVRGRWQ